MHHIFARLYSSYLELKQIKFEIYISLLYRKYECECKKYMFFGTIVRTCPPQGLWT